MAENYSFFNSKDHDRVYNARHWADYFAPLFKSGVFNGNLQVVANGGMTVKINEGYAWIDGYMYHLDAPLVLDIETASGNMNRKDNIVIRLDLTNRWVRGFVVTGTYYSKEAMPPEPGVSKIIHELVIARVNVEAGTTEITQDMIEDTRMDGDLCGWVCGTVERIDFTQITAQFDTFFKKYREDILADYKAYLQDIIELIAQLKRDGDTSYNELEEYFIDLKGQAQGMHNTYQEDLRVFYSDITYQGQQACDSFRSDITGYIEELKNRGDSSLAALIQQLVDFRNTHETEFLEFLQEMEDKLGEYPPGEFQLELDRLKAQQEDMMEMLLDGMAYTRLLTDDGNYIVDDKGEPILAGSPICKCKKEKEEKI